jgi:predicted methyltransferase
VGIAPTFRLALVWSAALSLSLHAQQPGRPASREFPPEDLASLAPPDRDEWQQPDRVMDALGIADGNRVADVGAGSGWFTTRLARRVGPNGRVYAEDVNRVMLESISHAALREGLKNVELRLGSSTDPNLPPGLQAALIVDLYSLADLEHQDPVTFLRNIARSLAPSGRLGVVDYKKDGAGGPGPELDKRVDPDQIIRDASAAGLKLRSHERFLRYQYLLVFSRAG